MRMFSPVQNSNAEAPSQRGTVTNIVQILRRNWRLIIAIALATLAVVAGVSFLMPKEYEADSQVFVSVNSGTDLTSLTQGSDFSQQRIKSYVVLVTARPILEEVIKQLNLPISAEELKEKITVESEPETVLLRIAARDRDPELAAKIVDVLTRTFMSSAEELEQQTSAGVPAVSISLVEKAEAPTEPVSPDIVRNCVYGLVIGIVLGLFGAYLRTVLDTRIRSASDSSEAIASPLLVRIPEDSEAASNPELLVDGKTNGFAEALRLLCTRLRFVAVDSPGKVLTVTSVEPGEGKSTMAIHLAAAAGESGLSVLLIDGDLRRPRLASSLGLEPAVGLSTLLSNQSCLSDSIQSFGSSDIDVLASGVLPPNPSEMLSSDAMRVFLDEIRRSYDLTIIDTSPASYTADAAILSRQTDGFVFVVRIDGSVKREDLRRTHQNLISAGARSIGVIANRCNPGQADSGKYYGQARGRR